MRQLETARTTNNLNVENHAIEFQFSFQIGLYLSLVPLQNEFQAFC